MNAGFICRCGGGSGVPTLPRICCGVLLQCFFFSWVGVVLHKHFGEAPASQMNREQSKGGAPLLSCYRVWGGKKVPHPDNPRAQLFPARFGCPSCPPSVSLTAASFLSYLLQIS